MKKPEIINFDVYDDDPEWMDSWGLLHNVREAHAYCGIRTQEKYIQDHEFSAWNYGIEKR